MKKIIFNKDQKVSMHSHNMDISPCSFRIPEYLQSQFKKKIEKYKNLSLYFPFLLKTYKHIAYTGGLPQFKRIKKVYQDRGLNARPISLRSTSEDWSEFKILSEALNMSMCKLFIYLFLLDCSDFEVLIGKLFVKTAVTANKPFKATCVISISPKNQTLERIFKFRLDRYH